MNRQQRIITEQVNDDAGFPLVQQVAAQVDGTPEECADVLLKVKRLAVEYLYETEKLTGNTRVFANGAIVSEIRCADCGGLFWETGPPFAKCVDCR